MLRKVGATLILVGVFLPFATVCSGTAPVVPINFLVQPRDLAEFAVWGMPVLFLILFAAMALVTQVRELVARYWKVTYPVSALWYLGLSGMWIVGSVTEGWSAVLMALVSLGLTLPLFIWAWRRHPPAGRVPLYLLLAGGSIWLLLFLDYFSDLEYGAYVLLTGLVVCTVTEVQELRRAAPDGEP